MATHRLAQFTANIVRAREMTALGLSLVGMTSGRVDSSDIYRSALVQSVAALDSYVHGVVLDRAVDFLLGRLAYSASGTKIGLHFEAVQTLLSSSAPSELEISARTYVAQRLSLETFQKPDDIAKALAMVGVSKIWSSAFADPQAARVALGLIVDRRNRIVHSCDIDPLQPGAITPLSGSDALDAISTVESTVAAIDPLC